MGCGSSRPVELATPRQSSQLDPDGTAVLAKETNFGPDEIGALRELYDKLSNELHHDGFIHKDELAWALFKAHRDNLFVDRVFELFDMKQNNVIEFGEFVRSLSVFHPNAPLEEKSKFAFRIYDIDSSGAIEPPEIKRFLVAVMADNPDIHLDEEALNRIVEDTVKEIDLVGDGKINPEEWHSLVQRNPGIISYMTLPVLTELSCKFPPSPDTVERAKRGGKRLSMDAVRHNMTRISSGKR
jgi:serine/threonine-protein phosphatase 2B regulatory subunit